jgi:threonine/homoserine/homoserine lactone efflux protein
MNIVDHCIGCFLGLVAAMTALCLGVKYHIAHPLIFTVLVYATVHLIMFLVLAGERYNEEEHVDDLL